MKYGESYRCVQCRDEGIGGEDLFEEFDRYGIFAGLFHPVCWPKSAYASFEFDEAYAGEHLEEEM